MKNKFIKWSQYQLNYAVEQINHQTPIHQQNKGHIKIQISIHILNIIQLFFKNILTERC